MAGNRIGGIKAAEKNKAKYGSDFYREIGRKGGSVKGVSKGFGFQWDCKCNEFPFTHKHPQCAGRRGGRISKRGKAEKGL